MRREILSRGVELERLLEGGGWEVGMRGGYYAWVRLPLSCLSLRVFSSLRIQTDEKRNRSDTPSRKSPPGQSQNKSQTTLDSSSYPDLSSLSRLIRRSGKTRTDI